MGFLLIILAILSCPMDFDHMGALSIPRRCWLGVFSAAAVVTVVPVLWRGRVWQRVLAGVLLLSPVLSLFESLSTFASKRDESLSHTTA